MNLLVDNDFVYGDVIVYSNFLERHFLKETCENSMKVFKNICLNFPFELLIMFDVFREHAC